MRKTESVTPSTLHAAQYRNQLYEYNGPYQGDSRLRRRGLPVLQLPGSRPDHGDCDSEPAVAFLRPEDDSEPAPEEPRLSDA